MLAYLQIFADKEVLLDPFSDEERGRLLTAMLRYALHDEEIVLEGNERYIWPVFKQMIDQSKDALSKKQKAGAARQEQSTAQQQAAEGEHPSAPASTAQQQAAESPIIQESRIKNQESRYKNKEHKRESGAALQRFIPPTAEQVQEYCRENGITGVEAQRFVDFYASKGWTVGNAPMKDWRAAVRNWAKRETERAAPRSSAQVLHAQNYTQRQYTEEELGGDAFRKLIAEMEKDKPPPLVKTVNAHSQLAETMAYQEVANAKS